MKKNLRILSYFMLMLPAFMMWSACGESNKKGKQEAHADVPFIQDYSVKYYAESPEMTLFRVGLDRNGKIQLLGSNYRLQHLTHGKFLYPGKVVEDNSYRFMKEKDIVDLTVVAGQFVYLDKTHVLSNAWAGKLFVSHELESPKFLAGNEDLEFVATDGHKLHLIKEEGIVWRGAVTGSAPVVGLVAKKAHGNTPSYFLVITEREVFQGFPADKHLELVFSADEGEEFTAADVDEEKGELLVGTTSGYILYDLKTKQRVGERQEKLPETSITAVRAINGNWWVGTTHGAFKVRQDEGFDYYEGERWIPSNTIVQIEEGPKNSVLLLTTQGLGHIHFKEMTLYEKALYFEKQVRARHIRNGFNATLSGMTRGDLSTGFMSDSDNDGLWTSLYLAGQGFRYAVTKEDEALANIIESLDAMERLFDINPVEGFTARSFERRGTRDVLGDPERWQLADHPEWFWKATTSSDEAIGHLFAYGVIAELVDHQPTKEKAIKLIDTLMSHIVKHDLYMIDYDGKPTTWARWNPEYVNSFPTNVGDRKLNSSNIIGMLQTAYHFTGKEKYKEKALDLMENHGYLENLMRPMSEIGMAPEDADDWSKLLSDGWNHSDDEMYFAGYWGLYRYALNDTLKAQYKEAIIDHWEAERPEKDGAWNIFTAMVGIEKFDLKEAIWYLQEYPLDLINWKVSNSHRKDLNFWTPNFRNQTLDKVLPPDELRITRHNANRFGLDGGGNGNAENSAGDIWLFPYWMGRYLNVISASQ
jgi:hypothetical protein